VTVAIGLTLFFCSGVTCGGLLFLVGRTKTTLAQVTTSIQQQVNPPLVAPQWANNWITTEYLTRIYTESLDAVIADKQVVERLGKSIEPVNEADELYRRITETAAGSPAAGDAALAGAVPYVNAGKETIEYDIKGSKGEATVTVEGSIRSMQPPGSFGEFRPTKITLKFKDGTEMDVPVQKEPEEPAEPQP
jgi:hypothetical protein